MNLLSVFFLSQNLWFLTNHIIYFSDECISTRLRRNKYFNNSYLEFDGREPTRSLLWFINFVICLFNSFCDSLNCLSIMWRFLFLIQMYKTYLFRRFSSMILNLFSKKKNWIVRKTILNFNWKNYYIKLLKNMNWIFGEEQCLSDVITSFCPLHVN